MANIAMFHSVLGLRPMEIEGAERLRAAGHDVCLPDLFNGARTDNLEEGFSVKERIGWDAICARAREAAKALPQDAFLIGISMGAGVVAEIWPARPRTRGVALLHGLASVPRTARPGTKVQLHIGSRDTLFPPQEFSAWQQAARVSGLTIDAFTYNNAGHFFTDEGSPEYNKVATSLLWPRLLEFLAVPA